MENKKLYYIAVGIGKTPLLVNNNTTALLYDDVEKAKQTAQNFANKYRMSISAEPMGSKGKFFREMSERNIKSFLMNGEGKILGFNDFKVNIYEDVQIKAETPTENVTRPLTPVAEKRTIPSSPRRSVAPQIFFVVIVVIMLVGLVRACASRSAQDTTSVPTKPINPPNSYDFNREFDGKYYEPPFHNEYKMPYTLGSEEMQELMEKWGITQNEDEDDSTQIPSTEPEAEEQVAE